jgi:hypothetical protein
MPEDKSNNELSRYFFNNPGRYMRKWGHYFSVYERHFSPFRGRPLQILEVGCFQGGSLQMWRQYFGPQAQIHGVDIDVRCKQFEEPGTRIHIGDQGDPAFLQELTAALPPLDIVIDDGGHFMHQQILTLEYLFPKLKEGGVYVCEDLHTSYWESHGGGYRKPNTFIETAKGLVDRLNAWHSRDAETFYVDGWTQQLDSLHFYDSMLVVEKRFRQPPQEFETGARSFPADPTGQPWHGPGP